MDVMFLHGRESGPQGAKITALREAGWTVQAPDCQGIEDVERRVAIAHEALEGAPAPLLLVGSSMGGLAAALLWSRIAETALASTVHAVLLLAPALHGEAARGIDRAHPRTTLLHGREDDIVPVEASRAFAARHGCRLVEVEDGHRLAASHPAILAELQALLA